MSRLKYILGIQFYIEQKTNVRVMTAELCKANIAVQSCAPEASRKAVILGSNPVLS